MALPLYLVGSALASALDNENIFAAPRLSHVPTSVLDQTLHIPFRPIFTHPLTGSSQRLQDITGSVLDKAIKDAGWCNAELKDCAVFIGSTSFSLYTAERLYSTAVEQGAQTDTILTAQSELANFIQQRLPQAQVFSFNTACTSSANAMIYAAKMIRSNRCKNALVIGLEFFNTITLMGFHSLGLISRSQAMQPFGSNRDGLILGEGCSAIALSATKPEKPALEFISGATLGDIHSMTAANPDGSSIEQVIRQALSAGNLSAEDIAGIKLHGTASLANDDAEFAGLTRIYGNNMPPVCALKPLLGHTLGACGSNELVLLQHYLLNDKWPNHCDYALDPNLDIGLNKAPNTSAAGFYLLNYFGFGGSNTALIIRKAA